MSRFKEIEILNGIRDGKQDVLTKFYNENLPKISRFVISNSGCEEDAEDVFQDALVITYQKLNENSLDLTCSIETFVYAVGRNIWMNKLRKSKKEVKQTDFLKDILSSDSTILDQLEKQEKQFLFQKHFLKLGTTCQKILSLFFQGNNMDQISKLMDYSNGYARKKKFECKKNLIEMIESDSRFRELNETSILEGKK